MPGTYATDGASADQNGSQALGGMSTGIGVSARNSGQPLIQTATAADFAAARIGSPTGQNGLAVGALTAGTGYTNGTYLLNAANGGLTGGTGDLNGEIQVTVAGGAITAAVVTKGGRYLTAPSVNLAALGGGSGGAIPLTVPADGVVAALGAAYGTNKGVRYLVAAGAVAVNAAVSGGYLNRSTRAMVAGDAVWAVAP
jgi:hypothetical protein